MALSRVLIAVLLLCAALGYVESKEINRKPGTLMLNMLIKNEAEHLRRTLPKWAEIVDYWLVGVDDANTDESVDIINQYLGHLPGEIVTVHFDGMGPTWSQVMEVGINKYPEADFGVLADADHEPAGQWDKTLLDPTCSRMYYTIWMSDRGTKRTLDWMYRNIPGAKVHRRTHQYLMVPSIPNQAQYACWSNFEMTEQTGGYQDRSGKKELNYIKFLEDDMKELGEDGRSLFYASHAYLGLYRGNNLRKKSSENIHYLHKAIDYLQRRLKIDGFLEEKFWAAYVLADIYHNNLGDWAGAEKYYLICEELDAEHTFPLYQRGKYYREENDFQSALPILAKAAAMRPIERTLNSQPIVQMCHVKVELAQLLSDYGQTNSLPAAELQKYLNLIGQANCEQAPELQSTLQTSVSRIRSILNRIKSSGSASSASKEASGSATDSHADRVKVVRELAQFLDDSMETLQGNLSADLYNTFNTQLGKLNTWLPRVDGKAVTCRQHRRVTTPILRFIRQNSIDINDGLEDTGALESLNALVERLRRTCR